MLSRLMTRREQLLLLGVGLAICAGAGALYYRDYSIEREGIRRAAAIPAAQAKPAPVETETLPIGLPLRPVSRPEEPIASAPLPPPPPKSLLVVSVGGAVNTPGIYRLTDDSRVQDLIDAAHGFRDDADPSDVNLAARLLDGTTLTVPSRGAALRDGKTLVLRSGQSAASMNLPQYTISGWRAVAVPPAEESRAAAAAPASGEAQKPAVSTHAGAVDLNTATQEMLEALPGIGPKTAEKIIAHRSRAPFRTVEDLKDVAGIGEKKFEAVRPLVMVEGAPPAASSSESASPSATPRRPARGDR